MVWAPSSTSWARSPALLPLNRQAYEMGLKLGEAAVKSPCILPFKALQYHIITTTEIFQKGGKRHVLSGIEGILRQAANACFGAVAVRGLDNTHEIPGWSRCWLRT